MEAPEDRRLRCGARGPGWIPSPPSRSHCEPPPGFPGHCSPRPPTSTCQLATPALPFLPFRPNRVRKPLHLGSPGGTAPPPWRPHSSRQPSPGIPSSHLTERDPPPAPRHPIHLHLHPEPVDQPRVHRPADPLGARGHPEPGTLLGTGQMPPQMLKC